MPGIDPVSSCLVVWHAVHSNTLVNCPVNLIKSVSLLITQIRLITIQVKPIKPIFQLIKLHDLIKSTMKNKIFSHSVIIELFFVYNLSK